MGWVGLGLVGSGWVRFSSIEFGAMETQPAIDTIEVDITNTIYIMQIKNENVQADSINIGDTLAASASTESSLPSTPIDMENGSELFFFFWIVRISLAFD